MENTTLPPPIPQPVKPEFECPACHSMHPVGTAFCPNLGTPITLLAAGSSPVASSVADSTNLLTSPLPGTDKVVETSSKAATASDVASAAAGSPIQQAAPVQPSTPVITAPISDSDRVAGIKVITVPRMTTYHMPGLCVACGKPLNGSTAKIKTSVQQTSGNLRTTLSLDFPLCFECDANQKTYTKNSNRAVGISAAITGVLAIAFLVIGLLTAAGSSQKGNIWGGAICGGLALWLILFGIINAIMNKKLPQPIRTMHDVITKSVAITGFSTLNVTFKFVNETFATLFGAMNLSDSNLLTNTLLDLLKKKT